MSPQGGKMTSYSNKEAAVIIDRIHSILCQDGHFDYADALRKILDQPAGPEWRLVKEGHDLPSGPPVDPGRTIYCFYLAPAGHYWIYDLPDVPATSWRNE